MRRDGQARVMAGERLTLFLPDLGGGGAERVALALMQGFLDRGHPVDLVLSQRRGALLPLVPAGVEIVDLGAPKLRDAMMPLVRYLRARRPHALHAMMWPLPLLAVAARTIARVDTRIVASEHTTFSLMPLGLRHRSVRALTRLVYARLDAVIAVSAGVADDLAAFVGIPRDRITVIHNPLLLPDELPDPAIMTGRWPGGTKRILAVGALKAEKNYPLLLRALARVREHVPASLLILGDGPLRSQLEAEAERLGLHDAVVFAGFTTDPWPFYAAADLFVLSSDAEGFGNVLIEAMHAGLPVVSTDCPNGPREIIGSSEYGILVPCGNDQLLGAAALDVLAKRQYLDSENLRTKARALGGKPCLISHIEIMIGSSLTNDCSPVGLSS